MVFQCLMVGQWLMPYLLQGRLWDQNLCCDEKCLRKTLVINNMSIFVFKYFLVDFLKYIFCIKIKISKYIFWQRDAKLEKGTTIVDGLEFFNCIFATWSHVKKGITILPSFAPNPSMNNKHFNFKDHFYLHIIMCSHPSILMNNKKLIT